MPHPNRKREAIITKITPVDAEHQVVTTQTIGEKKHMRKPCADCPWKKSSAGVFPAEAFRVSAHTAYDMASNSFGCHSAGSKTPKTCAGFLLRGAEHSLSVRMMAMKGEYDFNDISDDGHELYDSYRDMAIDNGVDPDDPVLAPCRD